MTGTGMSDSCSWCYDHLHFNPVEGIPLTKAKNSGELEFLIDLALMTGDKEWFEELSAELNEKVQTVI